MLIDILNEAQKVEIEDKTYLFEFDHLALATLEKDTQKSIYEIYNTIMEKKSLTLKDNISLLSAGMLKHHSEKEIDVLKKQIKEYPGFFNALKEVLYTAFSIPMMPPEILRECSFKKKDPTIEETGLNVLNTTGSETMLLPEQS